MEPSLHRLCVNCTDSVLESPRKVCVNCTNLVLESPRKVGQVWRWNLPHFEGSYSTPGNYQVREEMILLIIDGSITQIQMIDWFWWWRPSAVKSYRLSCLFVFRGARNRLHHWCSGLRHLVNTHILLKYSFRLITSINYLVWTLGEACPIYRHHPIITFSSLF